MAEKQNKDRRKAGPGPKPRTETTIHTADEIEEILLASVRAGTFPAKYYPTWSARVQIEIGKTVREGKIQRPQAQVKPAPKASAKPQKSEKKAEAGREDFPNVQSGFAKFVRIWNSGSLPKLNFEKAEFLQAFKDGNLAELLSRTIVGQKPDEVAQQDYRLAVANFMKEALGFKPHKTEKLIGRDERGKPKFELGDDGKPVLVDSVFDLALDVHEGVPKAKTLLSLSEEEYQASQQWFPGVRASLRKLSGQNQVRSKPNPDPRGSKAAAGGGAKSSTKEAFKSPLFCLFNDEVEEESSLQSSDEEFLSCTGEELTKRIQGYLHQKFPSKGYDKVDLGDANIRKYENLPSENRAFQSSEVKKFLDLEEKIGTMCCCLFIHNSERIASKLTIKMTEYLRKGDLKRLLVTPFGLEILKDLEEQAKEASGGKAGGGAKSK